MSDLIKQKQAELLQQQLVEHRQHNHRALKLLKLGFILTFLLYLAFALHLYLGDPLSWVAYFTTWQSTTGFFFMLSIIVLTALFLAWVKHHAYLHFGFYGSVTMIVVTVIGFALFAEFFSSSASQDAKSNIQLERSSAFQDTRKDSLSITADGLLTSRIAKARQTLARCEEKVKTGKEKHCEGDRAALQALLDSEQSSLQAQIQASTASQAMKYDRQDKLKADSYNPVIVMMAQFMSWFSGADYKEHIKTAVVFIMLIVAVSFEILHHFLSQTKGQSTAAIHSLELQIIELQSGAKTNPPPSPSLTISQPVGFNPSTPATATASALMPSISLNPTPLEVEKTARPIGFVWGTPTPQNRVHTPTHTTHTPDRVHTPTHTNQAPAVTAKTGTAEEQIPLFSTYLGKALATGKANTPEEVKAHLASLRSQPTETVCTHPTDRVHTPTHTPNKPLVAAPSLYKEWLSAIHAGQCKATVRETRPWVQGKIAGKGSQARRSTPTPVDIDALTQSLFQRAINDPNSKIIMNPDYRQGKAKYLLVETNHA